MSNTKKSPECFHISSTTDKDWDGNATIRAFVAHPERGENDLPLGEYGGRVISQTRTLEPFPLFVETEYRGHGIGQALVKRVVELARNENADTMRGHIESQYALDIRANLFGKENMRFYDEDLDDDGELKYTELPMTFDQARASLVRAASYEADLDRRNFGFVVEQDIQPTSQDQDKK